ncbi:major facilitator superfamily MFS_1 [Tolumonas auensis DSM 9187]|jgi:EmrB/QacA subfamily drug resistance transporter|uniref:Major facilitator superfamily MFS_1 n=1 Tax=Tolumonas auensis (strain DSM 9187 / NBRC 110442 / TA 4) TaxID=595494 RepID=C4LEC4_TOLAT|nr:MFS transporter [Tolumonas auensis]ACQ92941.1 major facilitator superfamily MFS_1 [Tolumonas auensis DSM 9187]
MTGLSDKKRWILLIILVSYFMIVLDISIVITGLPKIGADLHFSTAALSWVQNAYTLVFGGLLLLGARAGDILGRKRMFLIGLSLFTLASLMVGLALTADFMLASRALQGIGAAILAPSTLALLTTNFAEGPERNNAVSYYGATAGFAASLGLVAGGIFAGWLSWRVGFFINLPIGILLFIGARKYIVETEKHTGQFDLFGALSSTVGMSLLVYGIVRSSEEGLADSYAQLTLFTGVLLMIIFVINEWKAKQPIMPLRLFTHKGRNAALIARMLFLGASISFWFFTTQILQNVVGLSSLETGFAFLPTTLPQFIAAINIPKLTRRYNNARVLTISLGIFALGLFWLSQINEHSDYLVGVFMPMMLIGIGQGGAIGPLTVAGITDVPQKDAGAASGLVNVAHQFGSSVGLAILIVIFSSFQDPQLSLRGQLAHQISAALVGGTIMAIVAMLICWFAIGKNQKPEKSYLPDTAEKINA